MVKQRYIRNLNALSEEECRLLLQKDICVVGCGGLGGYIIELLLRIGVRKITAADGDVFEASNLNRQLLSNETVIGENKAKTAFLHAKTVNSDVEFVYHDTFFSESSSKDLIAGHDLVFDALDNIESRRILAKACDAEGIPLVHGAICGWMAQVSVLMPGSGLIDKLYPESAKIKDKTSLSFSPSLCASLQVSEGVKVLTGKGENLSGSVLYADLLNLEFEIIGL